MRILFIVPYTPNLIRVRPFNLIRSLASRGHQLTVFTLSNDNEDAADADALSDFCHQVVRLSMPRWRSLWNCLTAVPQGVPLQSAYCWQPEMADQLRQSISSYDEQGYFDVAHVEHLRGVRYGLLINKLNHLKDRRLPVIWDSVDSISSLFRQASAQSRSIFGRWITRFELGRTESYEGWLLSQFTNVLVTSPVDRQALLDLAAPDKPVANINVLPNGVDLDHFFPNPEVTRDPETLVVTGKMSYHANITMVLDLVQHVMPLVWEQRPAVKLFVVGKDPPVSIQNLNQHPSITVTGTVPDIRPYLWQASIALAPITYGVGIQNKILEAMACATPVVTSSRAIKALTAVNDQDLMVANGAEQYADQVVRLIADQELQRSLGTNGHAYVRAHHNWETIATRLEEIYTSAILPN